MTSSATELICLQFHGNFHDDANRHTFFSKGLSLSSFSVSGRGSAYFNGGAYGIVLHNLKDFSLGSTLRNDSYRSPSWYPCRHDNHFTLECWIYPIPGGKRYYPICCSFSLYWWPLGSIYGIPLRIGWFLFLDTKTMNLVMVGSCFGDEGKNIYMSRTSLKFREWTHIVIMSWYPSATYPSFKYFYINGNADGGYAPHTIPTPNYKYPFQSYDLAWGNGISYISYHGKPGGENEYAPLYIGVAPRLRYTDPQAVLSDLFTLDDPYYFSGYIEDFRIYLGPKYSTEGNDFDCYSLLSTTSTTTSTSTTVSTTTTSSTQTSTTTRLYGYELPIKTDSNDLCALPLGLNFFDRTFRHYVSIVNNVDIRGIDQVDGAFFDGSSFLKITRNEQDFCLGSSLASGISGEMTSVIQPPNCFTLEAYIWPNPSGERYLGICGSFSYHFFPCRDNLETIYVSEHNQNANIKTDFGVGWSLYLDTFTGHLVCIGYEHFKAEKRVYESRLPVPNKTWTHIVVMASEFGNMTRFLYFINGQPDRGKNPVTGELSSHETFFSDTYIRFGNGVHRSIVNAPTHSFAPFYIGVGARSSYTDPSSDPSDWLGVHNGHFFRGYICAFRISKTSRYPFTGIWITPPRLPS